MSGALVCVPDLLTQAAALDPRLELVRVHCTKVSHRDLGPPTAAPQQRTETVGSHKINGNQ
jgi:hypothetical protein